MWLLCLEGSLTSISNSITDMKFKGWDFCLAGQGAGEDPKREKSTWEREVKVCWEGGKVKLMIMIIMIMIMMMIIIMMIGWSGWVLFSWDNHFVGIITIIITVALIKSYSSSSICCIVFWHFSFDWGRVELSLSLWIYHLYIDDEFIHGENMSYSHTSSSWHIPTWWECAGKPSS